MYVCIYKNACIHNVYVFYIYSAAVRPYPVLNTAAVETIRCSLWSDNNFYCRDPTTIWMHYDMNACHVRTTFKVLEMYKSETLQAAFNEL